MLYSVKNVIKRDFSFIGIAVAIVIIVLIVVFAGKGKKNDELATVPASDISADISAPNDGVNNLKPSRTEEEKLSYENALRIYRNARIQLDGNCQAKPNKVTYKNGSKFMIDNRAGVARIVKIGSVFVIPAHGFKIITLSNSILPQTYFIDCDQSQNVATILLQK